MNRPTHEIDAYLDGEPTPDQALTLEDWIQSDPNNAKTFLTAIRLHQQIGTQLRKDRFDQALRNTDQTATTKDGDAAIQALAELARLDEQGLQSPMNFADWREEQANKAAAARHKIWLTRTLIGGALAAALLLVATLLAVALTVDAPESPIADNTPTKPAGSADPMLQDTPVATLTATHNAQWAQASLARGSQLHAGDRLTFTAGFAEITTNRGAIAILEAPATIELLDNDNALQLHSGRLVGICETETSKGFLVRTPHMDVTDLGTRFGISVQPDAVISTVFDGAIRLTDTAGIERILYKDQTATCRVDKDGQSIAINPSMPEVFHRLLSSRLVDPFGPYRPRFHGDAVAWRGPISRDVRSQRDTADRPLVYVEREPFTLTSEVQVDLTPEHTRFTHKPLEGVETSVPSGARVKVYLIHFDSRGGESIRGDYTLRFDGPILGVIASGQRLIETDATLGNSAVQYPEELFADKTNRGLDLDGLDPDYAEVDGQSLRLSFGVSNYLDQVRVIVQAEPNPAD